MTVHIVIRFMNDVRDSQGEQITHIADRLVFDAQAGCIYDYPAHGGEPVIFREGQEGWIHPSMINNEWPIMTMEAVDSDWDRFEQVVDEAEASTGAADTEGLSSCPDCGRTDRCPHWWMPSLFSEDPFPERPYPHHDTDEPDHDPAKFKVGDRVKISQNHDPARRHIFDGRVGTVTEGPRPYGHHRWKVSIDDHQSMLLNDQGVCFSDDELEAI